MSDVNRNAFRQRFERGELRLGGGEIGGKAHGLVFFLSMLEAEYDPNRFPKMHVEVPPFGVVGTEMFDLFLQQNGLADLAVDELSDEEILRAFQKGSLPQELASDLRRLVEEVETPLAVRSSSLLEDAIFSPFAGVYETRMLPNNQTDTKERLEVLEGALKHVYASTYFKLARDYVRAAGRTLADEKMGVLIQEIVGTRHGDSFYPLLSGVAKSHNFYPVAGSKPEDGIVSLALGLGRTIVDGGVCWTYSPDRPSAPPPYGSARDLLNNTQIDFWSVRMSPADAGTPFDGPDYLAKVSLEAAEPDGTLAMVASTYDPQSDRVRPGIGIKGPRIVNFWRMLEMEELPLNDVIKELLEICERAAGADVEIEFAMTVPPDGGTARFGFLQLRPMSVSNESVELTDEELESGDLLLMSRRAVGNGTMDTLRDVVYVKPEAFDGKVTRRIATELEALNGRLLDAGRPYVLMGFGRWGSSDTWLGIPVQWSAISGAKVIVESTLPSMNVEPSQGSHFFHNVMGSGTSFLCVRHDDLPGVEWQWLDRREAEYETDFIRHVSLEKPLMIKVDGRSGRAGIWR